MAEIALRALLAYLRRTSILVRAPTCKPAPAFRVPPLPQAWARWVAGNKGKHTR